VNNVTIKPASPNDADDILGLYHQLIGYPGCTWSLAYPNAENVARDLNNGSLWCLKVNGELAGAVSIGVSGDVAALGWAPQNPAELARLAVSPAYQGRGYASQLIAHALAIARARGHDGVILLVNPQHGEARHLYEKFGFIPDGEVFGWEHVWLRYQQVFG